MVDNNNRNSDHYNNPYQNIEAEFAKLHAKLDSNIGIIKKIDSTIDKLTEVSNQMDKILVTQETRINYQDSKLDKLERENDRLEQHINKELSLIRSELDSNDRRLTEKLNTFDKKLLDKINGLDKKIAAWAAAFAVIAAIITKFGITWLG